MKYGNTTLAHMIERLKTNQPDVYKKFFNRVYDVDASHHDWRLPLLEYAVNTYAFMSSGAPDKLPESNLFVLQTAWESLKHDNPLFFVSKELLSACMATKPFTEQTVLEMRLPHEAFAFVLPVGALSYGDNPCRFIAVTRQRKGAIQYPHPKYPFRVIAGDDALVVWMFFAEMQEAMIMRVSDEYLSNMTDLLGDHNWQDTVTKMDADGNWIEEKRVNDISHPEASAFAESAVHLALNLILAMEVVPDIVTRERKIKQIRRDRDRAIWTPNFVGRTFRIQHTSEDGKGTHASPKTHWRRGHIRRQQKGARYGCECGHGKSAHIIEHPSLDDDICGVGTCDCRNYRPVRHYEKVWIQPVLVNGGAK